MKNELLNIALNNLLDKLPLDFHWDIVEPMVKQNKLGKVIIPDGKIILTINDKTFPFWIETKNQLRAIHLPGIFELKKELNDLLVVAEIIYPNIRNKLKEEGVNYVDLAGNAFLTFGNNIIYMEGTKKHKIEKPPLTDRAFNKTGLILVFHILNNETFINLPYREIAATYMIAIGNVTYIFKNLEELGYVRKIATQHFKLLNKDELLKKWIQFYPNKLKPHLHLGNYIPWGIEIRDWKKLKLETKTTLWGAEPAANLLTEYLVPAELTLYTLKKRAELVKKLKLIPEPNGFIKLYKRFWEFTDDYKEIVPPILIYADLLNTGDPRNIETAQKIYERYIREKL